jgi:hypothetical protein
MSDLILTDEQMHEIVLQRVSSITREEWQERIKAANEAFDSQEAAELVYTRGVARPKRATASKRSHKVPEPAAR